MSNIWTAEELLLVFPHVDGEKAIALMKCIFANCQVETFCHGNVNKEDSIVLSKKVMHMITNGQKLCPMSDYIMFDQYRDVQLPIGTSEMSLKHEQHESNGVIMFQQVGLQDCIKQLARLQLLHKMIQEPWFNQIRMAEQLAYVTFATLKMSSGGSMGLCFLIQSAYSLHYLESRIDAFLDSLEVCLVLEACITSTH